MILLIHVRAENSVVLNFPRQQPGRRRARVMMMAGAVIFLSWTLRLNGALLVHVSGLHGTSCTVLAPLLHK